LAAALVVLLGAAFLVALPAFLGAVFLATFLGATFLGEAVLGAAVLAATVLAISKSQTSEYHRS